MKALFLSACFLTIFAFDALGQAAKPAATPPEGEVVKISTNLIRIDVSVTDAKSKPVTDLKQSDFDVFENGAKQKITSFSFVSSVRDRTPLLKPVEKTQDATLPAPPTLTPRPSALRRTIALLVDDLSLSFESVYYTKRALKKFVDEQMQEGDLVAVIRTGAGVGALQQFTSDKRMLHAAIERVKWNPMGSGGASAFERFTPSPLESQQNAGDTTVSEEDIQEEKNRIRAETDAAQQQVRFGNARRNQFCDQRCEGFSGTQVCGAFLGRFPTSYCGPLGRQGSFRHTRAPSTTYRPGQSLVGRRLHNGSREGFSTLV